MRVVSHLDPWVLEAELLDRVAATRARDPWGPILVIVPTTRLADHVKRRLVERLGTVLGVEILTHRGVARRLLALAQSPAPRALSRDVSDVVLGEVVRTPLPGRIREFLRERPRAIASLAGTLADLREAGVEPGAARRVLDGGDAELASIYAAWSERLSRLAVGGLSDDAAMVGRAIAVAAAGASRYSLIIHHGAYDLIGIHADLVNALDTGREVIALVPDRVDRVFGFERPGARTGVSDLEDLLARKSVRLAHAQGSRAEIRLASREALKAVADGASPHDAAILVRTFGPYASAVEELCAGGAPGWQTSLNSPLRRDPAIASLLARLRAEANGPERSWGAHAGAISDLSRAMLPASVAGAGAALSRILVAMRSIELDLGVGGLIPQPVAVDWVKAAIDRATVPQGAESGPMILDVMQARGLTLHTVAFVGLNSGIFPRVGRADPFLSDDSRRHLAKKTGRPVPIPTDTEGEERLLLLGALGSGREQVLLSWRRADESGRPVVPSLALRDLGRIVCGAPGADELSVRARALPAHPLARLESLAGAPGLLDADEEALLVALQSRIAVDGGRFLSQRAPELSEGCRWVEAVESFGPTTMAVDGRAGARSIDGIAATSLEALGRCPLKYFFGKVLRVPEPETLVGPLERDAADLGNRIHKVLELAYRSLVSLGALESGDPVRARAAAAKALDEAWARTADAVDEERARTYPLLERIEAERVGESLREFVAWDLDRLRRIGARPVEFERTLSESIALPSGRELSVKAKLDRIAEGPGVRRVGDYKTGRGSLKSRVDAKAMLAGLEMQVPLYAMLADAEVELLRVGPVVAAGANETERVTEPFRDFKTSAHRGGFLETIEVLLAMAERGVYPFRSERHCTWCAYRPACRKGHPPSEARQEAATDSSDARACWRKTTTQPLLADVRAEHAP